MFAKLWKDESGIVAIEYLFLATIVGLGLVVGFGNLEGALNAEFSELANAILALDQGYAVYTQSGCKGFKTGSNAFDTAGRVTFIVTVPLMPLQYSIIQVELKFSPQTRKKLPR